MDQITLQVGVKILLKNKEGKFLLVRRSLKKYPDAARADWDIVGGRINAGFSLMENLAREVDEETKLKITSTPVLVAAQDILRVQGKHVVRLTYIGTTEGNPVLDEENSDFGWFTAEQIKAMPETELDIYLKELLDKNILKIG